MPTYNDPDYMRKWRAANAEKIRESRRAYYQAHRKEANRASREWAAQNPEVTSLHRRASSANRVYEGRIDYQDVLAILARDGRKCRWCGKESLVDSDLTLDHVEPVNSAATICISCRRCNSSRWAPNWGRLPTLEERKQRVAEYHKQYYQKNRHKPSKPLTPEQTARRREYLRQYEKDNHERLAAYRREWRKAHPRKTK